MFKNVCARVYVLVRAKISGRTPMRFGVSNREKSVVDVSVRLDDTSKRLPVSRRCRGKSGGGGGGGGGWPILSLCILLRRRLSSEEVVVGGKGGQFFYVSCSENLRLFKG